MDEKDKANTYIRTFASDMEIVQKGGTPDLAPLTDAGASSPAPVAPAIPATPAQPAPPQAAPVAASPAPPALATPPALKRFEVPPLKTYSGDFSDRMQATKATEATILAAEQDAARPAPVSAEGESARPNIPVIIASVVLLLAGAGGLYAAYAHYRAQPALVAPPTPPPAPIFVDERVEVVGTGPDLVRAIAAEVARPPALGTVRLLTIASTTSAGNVFAALAAVSAPPVLLRNVNADGSMAGIVNVNGTASPFFILSVLSYSDTFAGILAWEPMMPLYLTDLYPPVAVASPVFTPVATTTASTTPAKKKLPVATTTPLATTTLGRLPAAAPRFVDVVVANHDARAYHDGAGHTLLIYGYWNSSTLVIARDEAAFAELMGRLATARTQ